MKVLRSGFSYIASVFFTLFLGMAAMVIGYLSGRHDLAHLCGRLWANLHLWVTGVSVRVEGLENIDLGRAYVYAANHQSLFDIFAILGRLPVQFRWLAKQELFRVPVVGHAMSATGYVPIDRGDRRKAFESLNLAATKVKEGTSIVIFPEGTRSLDGVLQEFRKGGFILAIKSQQPIVPISISGSHRILPKGGGWIIHPGTIRMTIGNPVPTAGCTTKDRDTLMMTVREEIRKHLTLREGGLLPDDEQTFY